MTIVDLPEDEPWRPKGERANYQRPASSPVLDNPAKPDRPEFTGSRGRLFWLAMGRMLITILTLGIGRFWMTTRLRKYYWSSLKVDGEPFEYTGTAVEKLIGFLTAIVILAAYLMVVNLALTFVGLSFFQGNIFALQLPLLALIPLGFWAQYRARRYILARTRWRGIRFGMAPGAWGYMWRALGWWLATILTLGLLYPLIQIKLSRYVTDRSFYGDLRFEQQGTVGPLMKSWMWTWAPPFLMLAAGGGMVADAAGMSLGNIEAAGGAVAGGAFGLMMLASVWIIVGYVRHKVFSFRYLHSNKVLDGETSFEFRIGFWPVVGVYIIGSMIVSFGAGLIGFLCALVGIGLAFALGVDFEAMAMLMEGSGENLGEAFAGFAGLGVFLLAYLPAIAAYIALSHAFITYPLIKETAFTTRIHDLSAADRARQRAHDAQAEAGGFADALGADVGGAF